MSEPITSSAAFAFARNAIAQDPSLLVAILDGVTAGYKAREERLRDKLTWSDQTVMAAAMLLSGKVQTPALKRHLEFCLTRYFEANGGGAGAANTWLKDHPAEESAA